jgi:hypothetical protein
VLRVLKYDFNWQLVYRMQVPLTLPKGVRLDCVAHFDNSPNNPDPRKEVKWGPQTWRYLYSCSARSERAVFTLV